MSDHRCHRGEHCAQSQISEVVWCGVACDCHTGPYAACSEPGGCGNYHITVAARYGARIEAMTGLCADCERIVASDIRALPCDYADLCHARLEGVSGNWGEVVSSSRELPIPLSLAFDTLAAQLVAEITTFVEPVAEQLNIDWDDRIVPEKRSRHGRAPRYREYVVVQEAARLLGNSVRTLLALPPMDYRLWIDGAPVEVAVDGLTAAMGLASLHHAARAALGTTRARVQLPAACPACTATALVREAGLDGVYCTECRTRWTDLDYERLTLVLAHEHRGAVPVRPVREDRVHSGWRGTNQRPVPHPEDPHALPYTLPSVHDLESVRR